MKILISGASIAGPAAALSLARYGHQVTVVEKSPTVRQGGYPIDLRGTGVHVADKMGLLPTLREAHIDMKLFRFFDDDGTEFAQIKPEHIIGGIEGFDVEIPRWTLGKLLYEASLEHGVEYQFNDSITAIEQDDDGAQVSFQSGQTETFDIVIGADGIHSKTRSVVFGPEEPFSLYLGYVFAAFSGLPAPEFVQQAGSYFNVNRVASIYAVKGQERPFNLFVLREPSENKARVASPEECRRMVREAFKNDGWLVPQMLDRMDEADDLYCDVVSQIKMSSWSSGRVALIGDAAYAPSFQTGQGSSLALVGGYVLAGELAKHKDHKTAFEGYEKVMRQFVEDNQSIALPDSWILVPKSEEAVTMRKDRIGSLQKNAAPDERALRNRQIHNSLELPDYPAWTR